MSRGDFPVVYVCVAALIPDGLAITTEQDLRMKFDIQQPVTTQMLGDFWIDNGETAVLEVASAVVKGEHNYLLNPTHPDFPRIAVDPPALFHFDACLFS